MREFKGVGETRKQRTIEDDEHYSVSESRKMIDDDGGACIEMRSVVTCPCFPPPCCSPVQNPKSHEIALYFRLRH